MLIITIIVSVVLIALDQIVKLWITGALAPDGYMPVIRGVVEFRYFENTGAAFSILEGKQYFLIALASILLLVVGFMIFVRQPKDKLELFSLVLIFAGGAGNLIDRIWHGYVVDYINLLFMRFAVFNLADCFVCVGGALLVIAFIRMEMKETREKKRLAAQQPPLQAAETSDGED